MSENSAVSTELDFDSWLAGGERKAHYVTLYARADLIADIEDLQRQMVVATRVAAEDESLGGTPNPNAELQERINALYLQLDSSKKEFRVSSRIAPEIEAIKEKVLVDLREEADAAAGKARNAAKELAKRMGVTTAVDINNMCRAQALQASNTVIEREVSMRAIADSTSVKVGDDWVPLTLAQVRSLYKALGESQADLLNKAFSRASNEAPVVTVPK